MKSKNLIPVSVCLLSGAIIVASMSGEHVEHLPDSQLNPQPVGGAQIVGTASLPSGYPGIVNF